jgi:hypothetical protein
MRAAVEAAIAAYVAADKSAPIADADGWIDWPGGECPLARGTTVEVLHRDESQWRCRALYTFAHPVCWRHDANNPQHDIVAYRVMPE